MPHFHLGNITQAVQGEFFTASCELDLGAGPSEREIIRLQRILPCPEMFR